MFSRVKSSMEDLEDDIHAVDQEEGNKETCLPWIRHYYGNVVSAHYIYTNPYIFPTP